MNDTELQTKSSHAAFATGDFVWLAAIVITLFLSGFPGWDILSPRTAVGGVSVMWVPTALLAGAVLRRLDRPLTIAVYCVVFLAAGLVTSLGNTDPVGTLGYLVGDLLEVSIAVTVWASWGGKSFQVDSPGAVVRFLAGSVLGSVVSGLYVTVLAHWDIAPVPGLQRNPAAVGIAWMTSNIATYLVIASLVIAITGRGAREFRERVSKTPLQHLAFAGLLLGLSATGMTFPHWLQSQTGVDLGNGGLILLAAPAAAWAAFRSGPVGAAATGALVGIPAIYATAWGFGPFGGADAPQGIFELQITLVLSAFAMLLVGSMAHEMRARREALERALDEVRVARQTQDQLQVAGRGLGG